jgi:transposase-like protein
MQAVKEVRSMERQRRHFSSEEKVKALRRHLVEKVAVSDVCEEFGIQPTQFYRWQQTLFENGTAAFERSDGRKASAQEARIAFLESRVQRKDEVLAELMEEHVALKKSLGEV